MTNEQMAQRLEELADGKNKSWLGPYAEMAYGVVVEDSDLIAAAEALRKNTVAALERDVERLREAMLRVRDRCTSAGQGTAYGELKDIRNYVPGDMRWCVELIDSSLAAIDRNWQKEASNG